MNRRTGYVAVTTGILACLLLGGGSSCSDPSPRRTVQCERTSIDDREYCVYGSQAITETGYDCPRDLDQGVPMGDGTVCTKDGKVPDRHRDDLRRRVDGTDDPDPPDTGIIDDAGTDASSDARADGDTASCSAPSSCPTSSSGGIPPTYHCHKPINPTAGQSFTLTIYGQHLTTYSDGEVEVATDTGFKQKIQVDHRCKVTVELPDYVWSNGKSFTVTVSNDSDQFQFEVRGN